MQISNLSVEDGRTCIKEKRCASAIVHTHQTFRKEEKHDECVSEFMQHSVEYAMKHDQSGSMF